MHTQIRPLQFALLLVVLISAPFVEASAQSPSATSPVFVDLEMVANIREEGLHRTGIPDVLSYMTDVLGARLTNSQDMKRAQEWLVAELDRMGLDNVALEPFMDYGASWDNEFVSLHMLEPDYQPMVGYPVSHTPGTPGALELDVVLADVFSRSGLEALRGTLRGKAVLSTPPADVDRSRFEKGTPRRTEDQLAELALQSINDRDVPDLYQERRADWNPRNGDQISAQEQLEFFVEEGVAVVLESRSGWPGAVRGFARAGAKEDRWAREGILSSVPVVALTPEHYNRLYRIRLRDIPAKVHIDVRNRIGEETTQAANVVGEIPGTDLADEVVMLGAHFDTWHASPNASDNTSGVAVMMEALRILKAVGAEPRRTIRIALWSGEEQGLWGARAYVRDHFGNPADSEVGVKPGYGKLSAYFNQDYGPGRYQGIWLQGNEHARRYFSAWMEPFQDMGMTTISSQPACCTDHVAFDEAGLPGFQFLQDRVGGTGGHTNLDFYDTIPVEDLMHNAVIVAAFVWHAAMIDEQIPRKGSPASR